MYTATGDLPSEFHVYLFASSMCVLGNRLLKDLSLSDCHKGEGPLRTLFCGNTTIDQNDLCEPYWLANNISQVRGIKGLASGVLLGKLKPKLFNDDADDKLSPLLVCR